MVALGSKIIKLETQCKILSHQRYFISWNIRRNIKNFEKLVDNKKNLLHGFWMVALGLTLHNLVT
jgi:hypothetical protein